MTKALIKSVGGAPSLEKLKITYTAVRLADIEELHAKAIRLEQLEFNEVSIYNADVLEYQAFYHPNPAMNVKSFSLRDVTPDNGFILGHAFEDWISYTGRKYIQLSNLHMNLDPEVDVEDEEVVGKALGIALKNMENLINCSVGICSLSQAILDAMENNGVQLGHFGFLVEDDDDSVTQIFGAIQAAQSVSSISSLAITRKTQDALPLTNCLLDICFNFNNLTSLQIDCRYPHITPLLLIDILENLTMLESFQYRDFMTDEDLDDDLFYKGLSNISIGRLISLCLSRFVIDDSDCTSMYKSNLLFDTILRSSPNLKDLIIDAENITARGSINLDVRGNWSLQRIRLNMPECRHYVFHHAFGKYWRDVNDQFVMRKALTRYQEGELPYYVNLTWDTTKISY